MLIPEKVADEDFGLVAGGFLGGPVADLGDDGPIAIVEIKVAGILGDHTVGSALNMVLEIVDSKKRSVTNKRPLAFHSHSVPA